MKILVIANQKGGVSKSITSYHLGWYLSELRNQRVLFLDVDEQAHSSLSLGKFATNLEASQFFGSDPIRLSAEPGQLVLAKGSPDLRKVEAMIDRQELVVNNLKARLAEVSESFDWCVIDTPGSNSIVAGAALYVSNQVLIPSTIDEYSLGVTITMLKRVLSLQKNVNKDLVIHGILPTIFDAAAPSQRRDLETFLHRFNQFVIRAKISKRSAYREAASDGKPVWQLKNNSSAREAAKEMKIAFDLIAEKMGVK